MSVLDIFDLWRRRLNSEGLRIERFDLNRPWGGFFVLDEKQSQAFANLYFDGQNVETLRIGGKLSPKILVVKPQARLSWQFHHRRAETWHVIQGPVGIIRSATDEEGEQVSFRSGETLILEQGERHRLVGLDNWGVVAEIWQHTNPDHPSDENDIVRIQDDYSRQ